MLAPFPTNPAKAGPQPSVRRLPPALMALSAVLFASGVLLGSSMLAAEEPPPAERVGADPPLGWQLPTAHGIRGITVGPIESSLQPNRGYSSPAFQRTLDLTARMGGNWISLTPFGRIWDLKPTGVDQSFEAPAKQTAQAIERAVHQAHARGLQVLIVPHLWAETGAWRGEIDPGSDAGWQRWTRGYERFLLFWADVANKSGADMLALGVELRTWVTTTHAPSFVKLIAKVRRRYHGLLTYAANWDDVHDTVIWGDLDVIALNAFFPLAEKEGASPLELLGLSEQHSADLRELARRWGKPVLFNEIGYTTRPDPALRPWEWPDTMKNVVVDQRAQAEAYRALIAPYLDEPWFMGLFVWRWYSDADDMSQEAEWGFSPFGKQAELVLRDAFNAHWAADSVRLVPGWSARATRVGVY